MRGTFANIRIRNQMVPGIEGGVTIHLPAGEQMSIYDAAMRYHDEGVPLVVFAGKEYGTGSSRDWAAKGTRCSASAPSSPRASSASTAPTSSAWACCRWPSSKARRGSRSASRATRRSPSAASPADLKPRQTMEAEITSADGTVERVPLLCRIDTLDELEYFRNGGILQYVLRNLAAA